MITAPFNFVPLSEKVFFPDWAEKVSHDIPFEDTQSGIIDIIMTAKSPIFIRDGLDDKTFCNHNGTYYVPSSSVKGMIRNVLEIMSFSKMNQFNDDTYAVRDLRNRELYMSKMTPDRTFCGWLTKKDGKYVIEDCGKPGRIKQNEIDKIFNIDFASKFKQGKFGNKAKDKTAKVKYEMIKSDNFVHGFEYVKKDVNRDIYCYDKKSNKQGTLVLTGQPSARKEPQGKKPSGKVYEFIFFENVGDLVLRDEVMQNFLFAYFDGRKTEPKESPDWTYWKRKLEKGEKVPVFFQKNGKEVTHFGLSYLYKLPYNYSVKDGLPPAHTDERKDLAETMFGYISKDDALKGRVQFSHFKTNGNVNVLKPRTEILGTPRASYYPMYVKQKEGKLFTTFMDERFNISGWKRYPVHSGSNVIKTTETGNENVGTTFTPLQEGVVFEGKVRYHNLKKAELGALLSALTFHNTKGCFHTIGMAKPLGYGKIQLKIEGIDNLEEYLKAFEVEMSEYVEEWSTSPQIKELLSMATEQQNSGNSKLKYMELAEFAKNKTGDKDYLRNYTALDNINTVEAKTFISQEDLEELRARQANRAKEEEERKRQREKALKEQKEWEVVYESTNIMIFEGFIRNYPDSRYIKTAKQKIDDLRAKAIKDKVDAADKEAKEKWEAVLRVDKKYYQKALEDFIKNYADSQYCDKAKKKLSLIDSDIGKDPKKESLSIENITDEDSLFKYISNNKKTLDDEIDILKPIVSTLFSQIESAKNKKKFIKNLDKKAYKGFSKKLDIDNG